MAAKLLVLVLAGFMVFHPSRPVEFAVSMFATVTVSAVVPDPEEGL